MPGHPVGFFLDESSIAYNALTIAETGRDEHGAAWPLYFEAFGEYKNAPFIYLVAGAFKVFGPSLDAARAVSALLGVATAAVLALLAARMTGRVVPTAVVTVAALACPWLFNLSRLVFEVAMLPVSVALLLLAVHRVAGRPRWSWLDAASVAAPLALVTYVYTAGRLLGPLLAAGLVVFAASGRLRNVAKAWVAYAVAMVPAGLYALAHPGALTARAETISARGGSSGGPLETLVRYVNDWNPIRLFLEGDTNSRHNVDGSAALPPTLGILAVIGLVVVVRRHRDDAWWRYVVLVLVLSPLPAAITTDELHTLRQAAMPVALIVLAIPGMLWLLERGQERSVWLVALVAGLVVQTAVFQIGFHRAAGRPSVAFDAGVPPLFRQALRLGDDPIAFEKTIYVHGLWYGELWDVPRERLVPPLTNPPPPGALLIGLNGCRGCQLLATRSEHLLLRTPRAPGVRPPSVPPSARGRGATPRRARARGPARPRERRRRAR